MNDNIEIRSVEMVRRIREEMTDILKGKSHPEIIEFFKKEGATEHEEASRRGDMQSHKRNVHSNH